MEHLRQLSRTMQSMQQTIFETASSTTHKVITFTKNTWLPIAENVWNAVKDVFSSLSSMVQSNPKTAIGIAVTVVTAITLSLAFLFFRKEKPTQKISIL
jgi:hypothetical protein